ncbi:hypothetical protein QAD02_016315 [Eretmocerus hayati]|uniref:Uncharacterized protein n=1 Tax=Eretmocerus hayati TaxID=131215 RepID=A0ACC2PAR5_9HYME|nr:hypothetical protein QAD02_016315 [Eretmocerus hayati]
MAGVLRCCGAWDKKSVISFLIVADGELCDRIYEAIQVNVRNRGYAIAVHKCESVTDILEAKPDLHVDFVIFAFDSKVTTSVRKVEDNIRLLDEFFIISGRVCLVNCYGESNTMGLSCHKANGLSEKFCLKLYSANIYETNGMKDLGERILNYSEALTGVSGEVPNLDILISL